MPSTKNVSVKDRATLRSVVRQQFKVLRDQIRAREAVLLDELNEDFKSQYAGNDRDMETVKRRNRDLQARVTEMVADEVARLRTEFPALKIGNQYDGTGYRPDFFSVTDPDRAVRLREAKDKIPVLVRSAYLTVNSQETDLLLALAKDSLDHGEASAFIEALPDRGSILPERVTLEAIEAKSS